MIRDPQAEYQRFGDESAKRGAPDHFIQFNRLFVDNQIWQSYAGLMDMVPGNPVAGGVCVDIGCKYGHTLPLFLVRGAHSAIGVDVVDEYLNAGREFVTSVYPNISFAHSDQGYLPIASNSVSFVLINEVISHVNPMYLPNLFNEVARILRPGGYVVISDGNNIANPDCRRDLIEVYDAWENGPSGRKTNRDVVDDAFIDIRRRLIRQRHPTLAADKVDYLAINTSGLFGDYFAATIDRYVSHGELIERPYRRGICPTNPLHGGTVMEYGFYPQQVIMALTACGLRAERAEPLPQLPAMPPMIFRTPRSVAGSLLRYVRYRWQLRNWPPPHVEGWGFQVRGLKEL